MQINNANNQSYRKLIVYQKSYQLVLLTYKITKRFPNNEIYVLVPQMRRAAISVVANIVEGYVKSKNEFARFIDISIGSASELGVFFEISKDLKYISDKDYIIISNLIVEVKKLLYSFKKSLRK